MFEKRNVIEAGRTPVEKGIKQASIEENTLTRAADAVADVLLKRSDHHNGTDADRHVK